MQLICTTLRSGSSGSSAQAGATYDQTTTDLGETPLIGLLKTLAGAACDVTTPGKLCTPQNRYEDLRTSRDFFLNSSSAAKRLKNQMFSCVLTDLRSDDVRKEEIRPKTQHDPTQPEPGKFEV